MPANEYRMARKIKIFTKAFTDIEKGVDYYEGQQRGLGRRFENEVNDIFKKILKFPYSASFAYSGVRYKVMDHFPYIILYEFENKYLHTQGF